MMDGFLNVLKPPGMTSFDVVAFLKKQFNMKKVGHLGTLDPGAAGVLPIAIGKATRFSSYLRCADKTYLAEMTFGKEFDSGDEFGTIISEQADFTLPTREELKKCLAKFRGEIEQTPPLHSAIKVGGKPAYLFARKGEHLTLKPRTITINSLELLECKEKSILLRIDASKGTYIRALCRDMGTELGIPATMSFLLRTRVDNFSLENAFTLEEIVFALKNDLLDKMLLPIDICIKHVKRYELAKDRKKAFLNGLRTTLPPHANCTRGTMRIYADGEFLGMGEITDDAKELFPVTVYKKEDNETRKK